MDCGVRGAVKMQPGETQKEVRGLGKTAHHSAHGPLAALPPSTVTLPGTPRTPNANTSSGSDPGSTQHHSTRSGSTHESRATLCNNVATMGNGHKPWYHRGPHQQTSYHLRAAWTKNPSTVCAHCGLTLDEGYQKWGINARWEADHREPEQPEGD